MEKSDSIGGFAEINLGYYESLNLRQRILLKGVSQFDTKNETLLDNDVKLANIHYDSLTVLDCPIKFTSDFSFLANENDNHFLYVNPNVVSVIEKIHLLLNKENFLLNLNTGLMFFQLLKLKFLMDII